MSITSSGGRTATLLTVLAVGLAYYFAARLGLVMQLPDTNASPVWPPSGIGLAALLLFGPRVAPGVLGGAFLANLLTLPVGAAGLTAAGLIALGNTAEIVLARALIVRYAGTSSPFDTVHGVFSFALAAAFACTAAASVGTASLVAVGIVPATVAGEVWFTWWLGDSVAMLVLTPALCSWATRPRWQAGPRRALEFLLLCALAAAAAVLLFGGWLASPVVASLPYLLVPALIWAAFRFGPRETATVAALFTLIATAETWFVMDDPAIKARAVFAPFLSHDVAPNETLLMLQLFVAALALTGLPLAAALAERRRMESSLREANETLETHVAARTVSLKSALDEKTILLQEVHHRVKNNLQVIASLLSLQAGNTEDSAIHAALNDSQGRVKSMALLHQLLYEQHDFARLDLGEYLSQLSRHALASADSARITLTLRVAPVALGLQRAVPCGLLVNELVSNVCKHAFPGARTGSLLLELHPADTGGTVLLVVADDGVGLPAETEPGKTRSLGLQLVALLAEQLEAKIELVRANGTRYEIRFRV